MKFNFVLTLLVLVLTGRAQAKPTPPGGRESGGGDVLVMNFQMAGQRVCDYLKTAPVADRFGLNPAAFCDAVTRVTVTSQDRTFLTNGTEVDAINTPSQFAIVLSQQRNFSKDMKELIQLSAHEYISVHGKDDRNYQVSGPLTFKIDTPDDVTSPPGVCLIINANYQCHDEFNTKLSITTNGGIYTMAGILYAGKPFKADGIERLVSYVPADSQRDVAYEAYMKVQCIDSGFELQARNNDFTNIDPKTGKYLLAGNSKRFYRILAKGDLSALTIYSRHLQLELKTGVVTEYKNRVVCDRVN